jgi:hypothetical protein
LKRERRWAAAALAAVAIFGLTACTSSAPQHQATPETAIKVSRTTTYRSVAEIKKDSSAVVIAIPRSAREMDVNGIPVTVTSAEIKSTIAGKSPASIQLQQFGSGTTPSPQTSPLLEAGREYLLFIQPLHLVPGDNTGRMVITGDQGIFERRDGRLVNIAFQSELPPSIDQESLT